MAGVGGRKPRGVSHPFPQLPRLNRVSPTPPSILRYLQTGKGRLRGPGAGYQEGLAPASGGAGGLGGGAYF